MLTTGSSLLPSPKDTASPQIISSTVWFLRSGSPIRSPNRSSQRQAEWGRAKKKKKKKESEFWRGKRFRESLREEFALIPFKQGQEYYTAVDSWWSIYSTLFQYDPNSLVHGVLFAKEQIKISRMLTAHLEAYGAARVGSSGVKFDRLQKTTSGQPIFAKDEETAREIRATLHYRPFFGGILRSYGRGREWRPADARAEPTAERTTAGSRPVEGAATAPENAFSYRSPASWP